MLHRSLQRQSLRVRLFVLAGFSLLLIAAILAIWRTANVDVARAYESIHAAQRSIQSAESEITSALALKERINHAVQSISRLRLLKKTYLQFQDPKAAERFHAHARTVEPDLAALRQESLLREFADYLQEFRQVADSRQQHAQLKRQMAECVKALRRPHPSLSVLPGFAYPRRVPSNTRRLACWMRQAVPTNILALNAQH